MEKPMLFRALAILPGLLFLVQGFGWLTNPAVAAEGLGMPLLDGVGRSTQIGDMGSFFMGVGIMITLGVVTLRSTWFYAAALLLGGTAVIRTLAWAVHDAPFTTQFIVIEVVVAALLIFVGTRFEGEASRA